MMNNFNQYVSPMHRFQLPYFPNNFPNINIPMNQMNPFGGGFMNHNIPYHLKFGGNNMIPPPFMNYFPNPYSNQYFKPFPNQNQYPLFNHYPMGQQQPSILSQFKKQDGKYDFNKIMNTSGQMFGAVNQISSLVKGISSTFKGI